MGSTWHPECFCCEMCHKELADLGFIKNQGRALCHECNAKVSHWFNNKSAKKSTIR